MIGAIVAGCSVGRNLSSFASASNEDVTGSITPTPVRSRGSSPEADLAFARLAVSDVLTRGDNDTSQPWENPETGARGSVTPLSMAYTAEGKTCRDFLASYVTGKSETWLQGAACRTAKGRWDVTSLKPWRRG